MSLTAVERLSLKEALVETCVSCGGTGRHLRVINPEPGRLATWESCFICHGTGRRVRTTHTPESAVALDEPSRFGLPTEDSPPPGPIADRWKLAQREMAAIPPTDWDEYAAWVFR